MTGLQPLKRSLNLIYTQVTLRLLMITKNWKELELDDQTVWGGEAAAEILTGMLKPQVLTLYTTHTKGDIMKKFRLKPDPDGFVQAYKPFWKIEADQETAPPLAVYADLILTGDERNFKVAKKIYREYL